MPFQMVLLNQREQCLRVLLHKHLLRNPLNLWRIGERDKEAAERQLEGQNYFIVLRDGASPLLSTNGKVLSCIALDDAKPIVSAGKIPYNSCIFSSYYTLHHL